MRNLFVLGLGLLSACGRNVSPGHSLRDTLPGGVVRVQNPAPSGWSDTAEITFTEIQRIQPPDGAPGELGDIWDLVRGDDGSVYVTELGPLRIAQFGPDGSYRRTIGREGAGPGEYQAPILAWVAGQLVVHDPRSKRGSVFDANGTFLRSFPTTCCVWRAIGTDTLGRVYTPVMPQTPSAEVMGNGWVRYTIDGAVIDTIWRRARTTPQRMWEYFPGPGSRSRYTIPFQPDLIDIPWAGGGLLIGDNADYSLTIAPHGSDSALVFGRTWRPATIPETVRRERLEAFTSGNEPLKAVAKLEDIPTVAPAFEALRVDAAHRIWVGLSTPGDSVGSTWDLFRPDGTWLGTVRAPFRARSLSFGPGEVVIATTDANDLPMIVRYRLDERGARGAP